jgi:DNA polymerase-1
VPTIDFETQAIGLRPTHFPPKSVGVAIQLDGYPEGAYLAYGHPEGNNSTWEQARAKLAEIWDQPIVTHNGGSFDLAVAAEEFGLPFPKIWHDTLYELFLLYPHEHTLALKPSAARLLGIEDTGRQLLRAWVLANVPGSKGGTWGGFIARANGSLVGQYAAQDVLMTTELHRLLHPQIVHHGMEKAYEREKLLAPILHQASIRGIRCDVDQLADNLQFYECVLLDCDVVIRKYLNAPNLNIDSDTELAAAMDAMGLIANWELTPTGRKSTSKKSMAKMLAGSSLTAILNYRASLSTCVSTFMRPWLELASHTGRVYPTWNQTRQAEKGGARTGRVTCQDPNLTNVSKEFPNPPPADFPPLPLMRSYLLPEEGHVWCRTDAVQQELRILAHYEDDQMMEAYRADPTIDFHNLAQQLIESNTGRRLKRKDVKTTAFSILYGAGAVTMAQRLGCTPTEAQELKNAYYQAVPGIRIVQREINQLVRMNKPIRTFGGRLYFCEEPWTDPSTGKTHTYEYKLLNYLIQGSAGDCTKKAIITYDTIHKDGVFMTQVYDELNISVPEECVAKEAALVQEAFARVELDVPMLSTSSWGENYGASETHSL